MWARAAALASASALAANAAMAHKRPGLAFSDTFSAKGTMASVAPASASASASGSMHFSLTDPSSDSNTSRDAVVASAPSARRLAVT